MSKYGGFSGLNEGKYGPETIFTQWLYEKEIFFGMKYKVKTIKVVVKKNKKHITNPILLIRGPIIENWDISWTLVMALDTKLDLQRRLKHLKHLKQLSKISKSIGFLRTLQKILPRPQMLTIYMSFVRPYLICGDITFDKAYNALFYQNFEKI